jgi:hypothetical protein
MIRSWFDWVDTFPTSIALRESSYGYTILLTSHVVTMCLFAGLVIMMDLRLAGLGNFRTPFTQLQKRLFPWQATGLTLNAISGTLLFYSQPLRYYGKVLFWTKIALLIVAGLNALAFHVTTYKSVADWDANPGLTPRAAKWAGIASLTLWAGVIIFGRLTAYNWLTYN